MIRRNESIPGKTSTASKIHSWSEEREHCKGQTHKCLCLEETIYWKCGCQEQRDNAMDLENELLLSPCPTAPIPQQHPPGLVPGPVLSRAAQQPAEGKSQFPILVFSVCALSCPSTEISLTLSRRLSIKMGQGNLGEVWKIKPISDGPILGGHKKTYFPEWPSSVSPN